MQAIIVIITPVTCLHMCENVKNVGKLLLSLAWFTWLDSSGSRKSSNPEAVATLWMCIHFCIIVETGTPDNFENVIRLTLCISKKQCEVILTQMLRTSNYSKYRPTVQEWKHIIVGLHSIDWLSNIIGICFWQGMYWCLIWSEKDCGLNLDIINRVAMAFSQSSQAHFFLSLSQYILICPIFPNRDYGRNRWRADLFFVRQWKYIYHRLFF